MNFCEDIYRTIW